MIPIKHLFTALFTVVLFTLILDNKKILSSKYNFYAFLFSITSVLVCIYIYRDDVEKFELDFPARIGCNSHVFFVSTRQRVTASFCVWCVCTAMALAVKLPHFFATLPPQAMEVEVVCEPFASRMEFYHWEVMITIRPRVVKAEPALLKLIAKSTCTPSKCFPNHLP